MTQVTIHENRKNAAVEIMGFPPNTAEYTGLVASHCPNGFCKLEIPAQKENQPEISWENILTGLAEAGFHTVKSREGEAGHFTGAEMRYYVTHDTLPVAEQEKAIALLLREKQRDSLRGKAESNGKAVSLA